ncbi:MAG TPA: PD-(D/E)XK nuclease family protein, partial [Candidatus Rifleibacterium sp.]|nr:PD-(D/E)XK nuclease family protein [Candidatus Rifleibacterium sp.]
ITEFITEYVLDPKAEMTIKMGRENNNDVVVLSTIHSAKGLEAPVVLMGIAKRPQFKDGEVMLNRGIDDEPAPVARGMVRLGFDFGPYQQREFICSPGWNNARPFEVNANAAEQLRLDYVACTRARDLLIVSRHNGKTGGTLTPLSKGVEEAMNNCPEFELPAVAAETASVATTTGPGNETVAEWREKCRAWRAASAGCEFAEESVTESVEKAEKAELAKSNMAKNSDGGREVGTFVHKVLCNLLRWRVTAAPKDAVRLELLLDHYLEDELKLQKKRPGLLKLLKNTLAGELWHEALQAGEFHTEVPVTCVAVAGRKRGTIINGTIDLVFRVPGGWKIVDYKTNLINDDEQRRIFNDFYRTQLDLYASQWETITGEKVLTRSLLYVRDGREVEL